MDKLTPQQVTLPDAPLTERERGMVEAMQKKITLAEAQRPREAASVRTMLRIALEGGANA